MLRLTTSFKPVPVLHKVKMVAKDKIRQGLSVCICLLSALGRVLSTLLLNLSWLKLWPIRHHLERLILYQVENCGPIKIPITETFKHFHLVLGSPFQVFALCLTHQPLCTEGSPRIMTIGCGLCPWPCQGNNAATTGSEKPLDWLNGWIPTTVPMSFNVIHSEFLICVATKCMGFESKGVLFLCSQTIHESIRKRLLPFLGST